SEHPHSHFVPLGTKWLASYLTQASELSFSKISAINLIVSSLINGLLHFLQYKTGIGTPQALCLEMHQSVLFSTIFDILFSPADGIHLTFLIAFKDFSIKSPTRTNHCGVAL